MPGSGSPWRIVTVYIVQRLERLGRHERDDAAVDLEATVDGGLDGERAIQCGGGDPGLVERDLDAGVARDVGRLVGRQRADDVERHGGGDGPGGGRRPVGSTQLDVIGRPRGERGGRPEEDGVLARRARR